MKIKTVVFLFCFISICFGENSLIYIGEGINNIRGKKPGPSGEFKFEYRPYYKIWILNQLFGISVSKNSQLYIFSGLVKDFTFNKIILAPSIVAGYYNKGNGRNLGFPLEFRSALEFSYLLKSSSRIGVQISHTSNASLSKKNPGLESFSFFFALPISD